MIEVTIEPTRLLLGQANELTVRLTNTGRGKCTNVVCRLKLPVQLVLLQGADRIEALSLEAGQSAAFVIGIRPKHVGVWEITGANVSYRDAQGRSQRVADFRRAVNVVPAPAPERVPVPELSVKLHTTELPLAQWEMIEGRIVNIGPTALNHLAVRIGGMVTCARGSAWKSLGALPAQAEAAFAFFVKANEGGSNVPIYIELNYTDRAGRAGHLRCETTLRIGNPPVKVAAPETEVRILFLSANPDDKIFLAPEQEFRGIQEQLRLAAGRDRFDLQPRLAIRTIDITQALLDVRPHIVHFSGHGDKSGALFFEDHVGKTQVVEPGALASLFEHFRDHVNCVVLNACHSKVLAEAMARHIDYVIGMSHGIYDAAGKAFAFGFYQALGSNCTIEEAFALGCRQVHLQEPAGGSQHLIPTLVKKSRHG